MEPLPDLSTLTDDDLRVMIRQLEKEEDEISFRRRVLHGRIDILRADLVARLREQVSAGEAQLADVERPIAPAVHDGSSNTARRRDIALDSRDLTVPRAIPSTSAISASDSPSR